MCHGAGRLHSILYIWRHPLFSGGKGGWLIFSISINLRSYTLAKSFYCESHHSRSSYLSQHDRGIHGSSDKRSNKSHANTFKNCPDSDFNTMSKQAFLGSLITCNVYELHFSCFSLKPWRFQVLLEHLNSDLIS